jgi:hypothetical protein
VFLNEKGGAYQNLTEIICKKEQDVKDQSRGELDVVTHLGSAV